MMRLWLTWPGNLNAYWWSKFAESQQRYKEMCRGINFGSFRLKISKRNLRRVPNSNLKNGNWILIVQMPWSKMLIISSWLKDRRRSKSDFVFFSLFLCLCLCLFLFFFGQCWSSHLGWKIEGGAGVSLSLSLYLSLSFSLWSVLIISSWLKDRRRGRSDLA